MRNRRRAVGGNSLDGVGAPGKNRRMPRAVLVVVVVVAWTAVAAAQTATPARTVTPTPQGTPIRLEVKPLEKTISVGELANYTATLVYPDETTRKNVTQKVQYTSSDPAIAEAPNTEGNRGRVNGIAPGVVTITGTDPGTTLSASGTLTVQGALVGLTLKPLEKNAVVGDVVTFTATGNLSDGNTKNMTQKVVYASSNTAVAICPNADGNKSQVQVVGVGTAIISAVDPVTEIASGAAGSATVTVSAPGATATGPTPTVTPGPSVCGDPDESGAVTVTDGVIVLSAAAGLPTDCRPAACDVNGDGGGSVTDGIRVLRVAAGLGDVLDCPE